MKLTFKVFALIFLLNTNSFARTLFLITHENRPREALMLKQTLLERFHLPAEFLQVSFQAKCAVNKKVILHVCIERNQQEDYRILYLNKKIMIDSFKELSKGKENAQ